MQKCRDRGRAVRKWYKMHYESASIQFLFNCTRNAARIIKDYFDSVAYSLSLLLAWVDFIFMLMLGMNIFFIFTRRWYKSLVIHATSLPLKLYLLSKDTLVCRFMECQGAKWTLKRDVEGMEVIGHDWRVDFEAQFVALYHETFLWLLPVSHQNRARFSSLHLYSRIMIDSRVALFSWKSHCVGVKYSLAAHVSTPYRRLFLVSRLSYIL